MAAELRLVPQSERHQTDQQHSGHDGGFLAFRALTGPCRCTILICKSKSQCQARKLLIAGMKSGPEANISMSHGNIMNRIVSICCPHTLPISRQMP
ncbi:hypothetical protein WJX79_005684 [Trebouxia sp. C0005]